MHPDAPYAAKAALAAQRQGKFWQMHDKLFEANNSQKPDALSRTRWTRWRATIGLDMESFRRDATSPETAQVIRDDQAQAASWAPTAPRTSSSTARASPAPCPSRPSRRSSTRR